MRLPILSARPIVLSFWTSLVGLFVLSVGVEPASAERRVALVIGNNSYQHMPPLTNPVRDTKAVATALRKLDFTVVTGEDLNREDLYSVGEKFIEQTKEADVALLFYSGHGLGDKKRTYIVPIDVDFSKSFGLSRLIPLDHFVGLMTSKLNLVFLDACRDNPDQTAPSGFKFGELVEMETEREDGDLLISYATQPGSTAEDGTGKHSPYAAALLEHIKTPGLSLHELLSKVNRSVMTATNNRQVPKVYYSATDNFFFKPGKEPALEELQAAVELEKISVDTGRVIAKYEAVVLKFAKSASAKRALERIKELKAIERQRKNPPKTEDKRAMVFIPGGEFLSGCGKDKALCTEGRTDEEKGADEKVNNLTSTHVDAFWIDKREVTVAVYEQCVVAEKCDANVKEPDRTRGGKNYCTWNQKHIEPLLPINCVSWSQAAAYCKWAGKRLPTGMEWEKAARGKDGREFPWGGGKNDQMANLADETLRNHEEWDEIRGVNDDVKISEGYRDRHMEIAPVGSYPAGASPYGVLDVAGNVWEWVNDWHKKDETLYRRGGSWLSNFSRTRTFFHAWREPEQKRANLGFRCALSPSSSLHPYSQDPE